MLRGGAEVWWRPCARGEESGCRFTAIRKGPVFMEETTICQASAQVILALTAAGRSRTTIKRHRAEFNALGRFLEARGRGVPSEADCLDFIAERSGSRLASLRERTGSRRAQLARRPLILLMEVLAGALAGKPITLWEAELGNYETGMDHPPREQFWRAPWLCVGAHLPSADAPTLRSLTVALDDLYHLTMDGRFCSPQWARIEGVERPGEEQEDGSLLIPYFLPVVGGFRAGWSSGSTDDATYFVDTHATRPLVTPATEAMPGLKLDLMTKRTRGGQRVELSVEARGRIVPMDDAFTPAEVPERLSPLLELVSLATYAAGAVTWMSAVTEDEQEVSLLCRLGHRSEPDARTQSGGVVFTLEDVPLGHYLEVRQRMTSKAQARYAWNVVAGLVGHSPRLVEEHVSQVLAAAEVLHRWCLGGSRGTDLKDRLLALYGRLPDDVRVKIDLDVDKWAGWAVWARNHVDHGGAETHRDVGDFYRMKVISDSVRLVTYLVLLTELGVPEDKVKEALLNHPRISVLRRRCAELVLLPELPG